MLNALTSGDLERGDHPIFNVGKLGRAYQEHLADTLKGGGVGGGIAELEPDHAAGSKSLSLEVRGGLRRVRGRHAQLMA